MGKLVLYGVDASPPVRNCLLTLRALNLPFEFKEIDLLTKQQLSPEYMKKNPQHTVPTLEDDGHVIWESHAICAYLVRKYAKTDALYPKDFLARALVDQRLHFESGVLFERCLRNTISPLINNNMDLPQEKLDVILEAYDLLETFLKDRQYMAGDQMTLADFSIVTTATSLVAFVEIDAAKFPKLSAWIKRMEQVPHFQEDNTVGADKVVNMIKSMPYKIVQ